MVTTLDGLVLDQWFSRPGTQTRSVSITWELLQVQILGLHSRPSESETLGVEPRNGLRNLPGDSDAHQSSRILIALGNVAQCNGAGFAAAAAAKLRQSCPTLCDPIDGSPPGSPIRPWDSPGKNRSGLPFPSPMHESEKGK